MVELVRQNLKNNNKKFNDVEIRLREKLDATIPIKHVGSTAIPNMYGKNIIDIVIGANDKNQFYNINKSLETLGFFASKKSKDEIYQFFSSVEGETTSGDIHLHVVLKNTQRYLEFLALKEYLTNNKYEAKAYSEFKKNILYLGNKDRREYKRLKSEYVSLLLKKAMKEFSKII